MKKINYPIFFIVLFLFEAASAQQQEARYHLSMRLENGYGPFQFPFSVLSHQSSSEEEEWGITNEGLTGIPTDWKNPIVKLVGLDYHQFIYQSYCLGKITQKFFEELKDAWRWDVIESNYSKKAIKCSFYLVYQVLEGGAVLCIVDSDNDMDLSDEKIFSPPLLPNPSSLQKLNIDSLAARPIYIQHEVFSEGKIISGETPLVVVQMNGNVMLNVPRFGVASLTVGDKEHVVYCTNEFSSNLYENASVIAADSLLDRRSVDREMLKRKGDYFTIEDRTFQNLGASFAKKEIYLKEIVNSSEPELVASLFVKKLVGYDLHSNGWFTYQEPYKKFLLLEFWAPWCGPCIRQFPKINELQTKMGKSKLEVIGVLSKRDTTNADNIIGKHKLSWRQIISDEDNNLIEKLNIQAFPTTVLIAPDGSVVGKNLTFSTIEEKINSHKD